MNEELKKLGLRGTDKVTGFEGVLASVSFDLYGCIMGLLTPQMGKDGKRADSEWFDMKRITTGKRVMDAPLYDAPIKSPRPLSERVAGPAERPRSRL